jgi:hypothetical protein
MTNARHARTFSDRIPIAAEDRSGFTAGQPLRAQPPVRFVGGAARALRPTVPLSRDPGQITKRCEHFDCSFCSEDPLQSCPTRPCPSSDNHRANLAGRSAGVPLRRLNRCCVRTSERLDIRRHVPGSTLSASPPTPPGDCSTRESMVGKVRLTSTSGLGRTTRDEPNRVPW